MKSKNLQMTRCLCSAAVLATLTACGGGDSGPPSTYTVGGTLTGLAGLVVVLQNDSGDDLPISVSGSFTFATRMLSGASYSVTVKTQPTPEICTVANGAGTIVATDVTNVTVTCAGPRKGYAAPGLMGSGNGGSNDISAFGVKSASGALAAAPGSPFAAGTDPKALALYRVFGTYLYVANAGSDTVSAFAVDTSSESLTPLSPATFATGKGPSAIAVDPIGGFIYVANSGGSNDVSAFSVDPTTGILTPVAGSPFPAGANPLDLALGAAGKFLYTANPDATNPSISGFSVDSGTLTPLSGSPFPLAVSHDIATDRAGAYLYVTTGASIVGYAIDAATGALTALPGFQVSAGANAYSMSIDPTNQFLYVANDGAANVSGFTLDASTGALTPMVGSAFPAGNRPDSVVTF